MKSGSLKTNLIGLSLNQIQRVAHFILVELNWSKKRTVSIWSKKIWYSLILMIYQSLISAQIFASPHQFHHQHFSLALRSWIVMQNYLGLLLASCKFHLVLSLLSMHQMLCFLNTSIFTWSYLCHSQSIMIFYRLP